MKPTTLTLTLPVSAFIALAFCTIAFAEEQAPPREKLHQEHLSRQAAVESAKAKQRKATEAIASELKSDIANSGTVAELLDKLVAAEGVLKRLHVQTALAIRSELTLEQLEKIEAMELADPELSDEQAKLVKRVIAPKAKKLHQAISDRQQAENPLPAEVRGLVGQFHRLMRERNFEAAAKALDEALALLS